MKEEAFLDVITVGEVVESDVVLKKQNEESSMNILKDSKDVGTMNEEVEAAAVPDKNN